MTVNEDFIRDKALSLLENLFGSDIPLPVDLKIVSKAVNAYVYCAEMPVDVSGFVYPPNGDVDKFLIGVNSAKSRTHQHFTVAHEIWHIINEDYGRMITLSSVINAVANTSYNLRRFERQANIFASELLMPSFLIRYFVEKGLINLPDLCKSFGVSAHVMEIRLFKELGYSKNYFYS